MREFLEASIRALVDDQDAVQILEERNGSRLRYTIRVAEGDRGRVIGKQGRIVNALRTVAQAAGAKNRVRVQVIVQTEGGSTDEGAEDAE
ncbi:MAG: RNA-binding protein [Armatimonadetes bacterium JP3_11]|nr:MAG: RNA-binding protein [Armatimonadetes bacterium CP1_7O]OYT75206.1 MAG: RNA-binding protein [Armatimonadetes bacterium JP3_11]RMH09955.1 MAG: KH domain-containing protein [Armatimonadota bacterium]